MNFNLIFKAVLLQYKADLLLRPLEHFLGQINVKSKSEKFDILDPFSLLKIALLSYNLLPHCVGSRGESA